MPMNLGALVVPGLAGLLLALPGVACAGPSAGPNPPTIPAGAWAGDGARAQVSSEGARFQFDCAGGETAPPLALDGEGRFDLAGSFELRAGPEPYRKRDARFRGAVSDGAMTLQVVFPDGSEGRGPFRLTLGGSGRPLQVCR